MTTTARAKVKETVLNTEHLAPYFEKLSERHTALTSALKESYERSQRINAEIVEAFIAGQRDMLDLAKQISAQPQDYASNIKAVVDATTVAQARALDIAKTLFREQTNVNGEFRKIFDTACAVTGPLGEASRNVLKFWTKTR